MKAEIKYIHSPDVPDLESYIPETEDNFGFLIQLMVGIPGKEGEESFDFILCTPKWLASRYKPDDIIPGLHHLIVFNYNYGAISNYLSRVVGELEGLDWTQVCQKLRFLGKWEFEDYRL